jgi:hypothetical protein
LNFLGKAREILHDIHLHISGMKVLSQGCINVDKLKLKELKSVHETHTRIRSLDEPTPLSVQDIVQSPISKHFIYLSFFHLFVIFMFPSF